MVLNTISQRIGSLFWCRTARINEKVDQKKLKKRFAVLFCSYFWDNYLLWSKTQNVFLFIVTHDILNHNCACFSKKYLEVITLINLHSPVRSFKVSAASWLWGCRQCNLRTICKSAVYFWRISGCFIIYSDLYWRAKIAWQQSFCLLQKY